MEWIIVGVVVAVIAFLCIAPMTRTFDPDTIYEDGDAGPQYDL